MSDALPHGWDLARISDLAVVNPAGSTTMTADDTPVNFIPMAGVSELTGRIDLSIKKPFGDVKKGFTRFKDGDVLFAKITPSMENGKIAVARELSNGLGCGTTEFHVIRPEHGIEADYLRYYFLRDAYRQEARRNMQGAVGQQRVPPDFIRDSPIPVAPSGEQSRIVSKIEELFSHIDEGERALQQVQSLVERYRRSVLKAAVTGELTREWREKNREQMESGEELLARILKARRDAWEWAELGKMKAKGVTPANDKWKEKYEEPLPPATTALPELPEDWAWASVDQLSGFITSGSRGWAKYYATHGALFLRVGNMQRLATGFDLTRRQFVNSPSSTEGSRTRTRERDLVISITADVGMAGVIGPELIDSYVNQHLALVRPVDGSLSYWMAWAVASPIIQSEISELKQGATKDGLTLDDIRAVQIPLPPRIEIAEAVVRVERLFDSGNRVVQQTQRERVAATASREAILRSAFSGDLVDQDPNDEPAEVLLERIVRERYQPNHVLNRSRRKATPR